MKKIMMIAAMMVATISANAQFEPGTFSLQPKVGGTISKVSNMPRLDFYNIKGDNVDVGRSFYVGALIGGEAEYQLTKIFSVAGGINFALQGCQCDNYEIKNGDNREKLKDPRLELAYLNLPFVANAYVYKGLAIKAGIQLGFMLSAKAKSSDEIKYKELDLDGTIESSWNVKSQMKTFDLSIPIGISYQVPTIPIYIDARYNLGLTKINKDGDTKYKNQVFQLTVGYKFAL